MSIQRLQSLTTWVLIASELSHVFCCVLPTMFSVLTLLSTMGMVSVMPALFVDMHDIMHAWEVPVILMSGALVLLGWGLHSIGERLDCRSTGCVHEPCGPKKKASSKLLKIATLLFVVNVSIYAVVHQGLDITASQPAAIHRHDH